MLIPGVENGAAAMLDTGSIGVGSNNGWAVTGSWIGAACSGGGRAYCICGMTPSGCCSYLAAATRSNKDNETR